MEKNLSVLLVEDSPTDALLIRYDVARSDGFNLDVKTASRLDDACSMLAAQRFDVVVLDLGLPDSSGIETFKRLRKAYPHIPIVVLTGTDDERTGYEAIRQGAQDYLIKGVHDGKAVARSIRYAIQRKQADAALQAKNDELSIANSKLETISRSMARDLRKPLDAILERSAMLAAGKKSGMDPDQIADAEQILHSARSMAQNIADLLEQ